MSPINQHHPLARSIVRILTADNHVIGTGFLVADRIICTCAHVVAHAVGTKPDNAVPPDALVTLDFPFFKERKEQDCAETAHDNFPITFKARVIAWKPLKQDDDSGDIALLELSSEPPAGAASARLLSFLSWAELERNPVDVYGFPTNYKHTGLWAGDYRLDKPLTNGLLQMTGTTALGIDIRPGNSGAPVWDKENEGVVGMVSTRAGDSDVDNRVAFLIPNSLIVELHSPLQASLQFLSTVPDWVRYAIRNLGYRFESDELIILADLFWACPYAREKENWQNAREIDDMLDAVYDLDYATHPDEVQSLEAYINKILPLGIDRAAVREIIRLLEPISLDVLKEYFVSVGIYTEDGLSNLSKSRNLLVAIVRKFARTQTQKTEGKWHPLLESLHLLMVRLKLPNSSPQEKQIASDLYEWIKCQASILNIPAPSSQSQTHTDKRAVLFILIRHDIQADIRNLHLSTFWVSAWLMPVDTIHNPIEILPCTNKGIEELLEALRDIINKNYSAPYRKWRISLIELCVPWMLLLYNFEQKHVVPVIDPEESQRLVCDHPVVFRLQDRLPPGQQEQLPDILQIANHLERRYESLSQKWRNYECWRHTVNQPDVCDPKEQEEIIFCPEQQNIDTSHDLNELKRNQNSVYVAGCTFVLPDSFRNDDKDEEITHILRDILEKNTRNTRNHQILGAVMKIGVPIAFFARGISKTHQELHTLLRQLIHGELYNWIKKGDVFEFGEWLKQYYTKDDRILGRHLMVLWDDPDRTPFDDPLDDTGIV